MTFMRQHEDGRIAVFFGGNPVEFDADYSGRTLDELSPLQEQLREAAVEVSRMLADTPEAQMMQKLTDERGRVQEAIQAMPGVVAA